MLTVKFCSGEVRGVEGIGKSLSIGQVVWAPSTEGLHQYLVFVGWSSGGRKLAYLPNLSSNTMVDHRFFFLNLSYGLVNRMKEHAY